MTTLDLITPCRFPLGDAVVTVDGAGRVAVARGGRIGRLDVPGLVRGRFAELAKIGSWGCIVGARAGEVVAIDGDTGTVRLLGTLERLDLLGDEGSYDPGGLERVRFHVLDDSALLVETEVAVARIHRVAGVVWQRLHDDITCRVVEVTGEHVRLSCDGDAHAYRLADGSVLFS